MDAQNLTERRLFLQLSELLCGCKPLSHPLANCYFDILSKDGSLLELLADYQSISGLNEDSQLTYIHEQFLPVSHYHKLIVDMVKLWYLGKLDAHPIRSGEYYFHYEALVWKVIGAHPPGLSGGYFGYWNYKPEN